MVCNKKSWKALAYLREIFWTLFEEKGIQIRIWVSKNYFLRSWRIHRERETESSRCIWGKTSSRMRTGREPLGDGLTSGHINRSHVSSNPLDVKAVGSHRKVLNRNSVCDTIYIFWTSLWLPQWEGLGENKAKNVEIHQKNVARKTWWQRRQRKATYPYVKSILETQFPQL